LTFDLYVDFIQSPRDLSENSQKLAVTSFDRCVSSCYPS
jgi:hypothetical protein